MRKGLRHALLYVAGLVIVGGAGLGAVRIWQQQTDDFTALAKKTLSEQPRGKAKQNAKQTSGAAN